MSIVKFMANFVKIHTAFVMKQFKETKMGDPESVSLDFGFDIQEAVAQRLAQKNKKTVQLNDLLKDTKFTKSEIRTMYRGFKQVRINNSYSFS